jgi:hypothetical protein
MLTTSLLGAVPTQLIIGLFPIQLNQLAMCICMTHLQPLFVLHCTLVRVQSDGSVHV